MELIKRIKRREGEEEMNWWTANGRVLERSGIYKRKGIEYLHELIKWITWMDERMKSLDRWSGWMLE